MKKTKPTLGLSLTVSFFVLFSPRVDACVPFSFQLIGDDASAGLDVCGVGMGLSHYVSSLYGFQFGLGIANARDFGGLQVAGLFGNNDDGWGIQISPGLSSALKFSGVQLSGVGNNVMLDGKRGDVNGIQVAGLVNTSGLFRGIQIAGIGNNTIETDGLQLSPFNNAGHMAGIRIGLSNFSETSFSGFDLGITNIVKGEVNGFQLGLFNYAKHLRGVQIGIVNFISYPTLPFSVSPLVNFAW